MGYYAVGGGEISLAREPTQEELRTMIDALDGVFDNVSYEHQQEDHYIVLGFDSKYHDDELEILNRVSDPNLVCGGEIYFTGEDGARWRYRYSKKANMWIDESAEFTWEYDKKLKWETASEFIGQIIDGFEDFLESKGIDIPNPEKEQSEAACILYGTDYGELQSYIESTLINWEVLPPL